MIRLLSIIFILGTCSISHAEEHRHKIVVIETPIFAEKIEKSYMCENGSISMDPNALPSLDSSKHRFGSYHGQNVVGLIGSHIDSTKYCIYHIAFYSVEDSGGPNIIRYEAALKYTLTLHDVVGLNLSLSGNSPSKYENYALRKLNEKGIKIITVVGNNYGVNLTQSSCNSFPACIQKKLRNPFNFFVLASGRSVDGKIRYSTFSNTSNYLTLQVEDGEDKGVPSLSGTSQSAAIFTGKLFSKVGLCGN